MPIAKAAIIGAGVMGSGIAAHLANAGVPVLLLDVPSDDGGNRSSLAANAIGRMLKTEPAPFMHKSAAKLVEPGNTEDDLARLSEVDWIVEAVVEDLDIKRALYAQIEAVRKDGSVVSSNTSTLPLRLLVEGQSERFARDFLITHFFNPPRYMRLLEIVAGATTRPKAIETIYDFADRRLGKSVVSCNDTPGFVANRIGNFWLQCAVNAARDHGLSVEEADAVMSRPVGIPKTGVFGLLDLVGIDLIPKVDAALAAALPEGDAYHGIRRDWPLLDRLIAEGYTGRKGKGGFYRLDKSGGNRVKLALDLTTGDYAPFEKPSLESLSASRTGGLKALVAQDDRGGRFAWDVLAQTLSYAATHVPETTDTIHAVDRALRNGYAWKHGPFELIDRLGAADFAARLAEEDRPVPPLLAKAAEAGSFYRVHDKRLQYLTVKGDFADVPRPEGVLLLEDIKRAAEPLARNGSASLWDLGDGVACLEVHTKLNTIDPDVLAIVQTAIKTVEREYKALVVYNEGTNFSAGANLGLALFAANTALWPMIENMVEQGQAAFAKLKAAPFPVVSAPSGLALGGGCEILLHSDAIQAHAESYIGLVETGVGLVPGWGGCTELLTRLAKAPKRPRGPMPPVAEAFETIGLAKVAKSAFEARELGFLRDGDGITFNRDRLLAEAKAKALELAQDYARPEPVALTLPGPSGKASLDLGLHRLRLQGLASAHDAVVARQLGEVLTGGPGTDIVEPVEPDAVRALERQAFMTLVKTEATLARMEHTLETGKPLRN